MRGSYGLVLVIFGLLSIGAQSADPGFMPVDWLPVIHVVLTFGLAWMAAAASMRVASRLAASTRRG